MLDGVVINVDAFGGADSFDLRHLNVTWQKPEPELGRSTRNRVDDARDVITQEAEASRLRVQLHRALPTQLRSLIVIN